MMITPSHSYFMFISSFLAITLFHECVAVSNTEFDSRSQKFDTDIPWPPKEKYFSQNVDHFNFQASSLKFQQRVLYEDKWYEKDGPIFFYCGNEGPIESFWNNTGFMFELAPTFKALVVFAEHRYYGRSLPFANSFQQPFIQFLSIEQALADFAYLINQAKPEFKLGSVPVIAFGGSYGGMLAAYMRVKYPHLVQGAIAASVPVEWVSGRGNFHKFFEATTANYQAVDDKCPTLMRKAYNESMELAKLGKSGLEKLSNQLRLCHPMTNDDEFKWMLKWTRNAFVMMSMMDYPYETSFMSSLPANPVNVSCKNAIAAPDSISALREAVAVMYNSSKDLTCFDYKRQFIDCADITGCGLGTASLAWDFQSCTEMNMYDESNSTSADMFPSLPVTRQQVINYCQNVWGVTPAFEQLSTFYGSDIWKSASNIVFSNGDLDPWMGGGILKDVSPTVVALLLHGGAHHLDLRAPNAADPPSARTVRQAETGHIVYWIKAFKHL